MLAPQILMALTATAAIYAPSPSLQSFQQQIPRQSPRVSTGVEGSVQTELGRSLPAVHVTLYDSAGNSKGRDTKGDGNFQFLNLAPGEYQLQFDARGFESWQQRIQVSSGNVLLLPVVLKPNAPLLYVRQVPLQPQLGPPPEMLPPPEIAAWRYIPISPPWMPLIIEPERVPLDAELFTQVPNRWKEDYSTIAEDYHDEQPYRRYGYPGEFPFVRGHWYDPFNRSKLKGDYPIIGKRTFLDITAVSDTLVDGRLIPTPTNVSTARQGETGFFGGFGQLLTAENLAVSLDLFHGDAAFRPVDWRVKVTADENINFLAVQETGIVNPSPRAGTTRFDTHGSLQEAFGEVKLADLSHSFDFVSTRVGIQTFNSDFRGFIFSDQEPGARLFGNFGSNRYQYNLAFFPMLEKDTNSGLNQFKYRHQDVYIANLYRQDFIKPGYAIQVSFHYDKDDPTIQYDKNGFLVRPAPIGAVVTDQVNTHYIRAYYYGLTGDGHFGRLNLTHAFYQVLGHDSFNTIADRRVSINAQMAAAELSLDKDWIRYRLSFFYASGSKNPNSGTARGFDAIFDDPNFAGGIFSFWNREGIRLTGTGVALESPDSLIPSLRSSKIEGDASFVNPGLLLYNAGADIDITPKLRGFLNLNVIRFAHPETLDLVLFQSGIHAGVGADSGIGLRYRPPLTDNIILTAGVNMFNPFQGFRDIYTQRVLFAGFLSVRFQF
jgi:Carboxypeptidase regulatory-like domain